MYSIHGIEHVKRRNGFLQSELGLSLIAFPLPSIGGCKEGTFRNFHEDLENFSLRNRSLIFFIHYVNTTTTTSSSLYTFLFTKN